MRAPKKGPDTIVPVHGYEAHGYRVLAPAYPGFDVEVEALRRDPTPIDALTRD